MEGQRRNKISSKRLTPGSNRNITQGREVPKGYVNPELKKAKEVKTTITERKRGLTDDAAKEKDAQLHEETPLQVVEKFRDLVREAQAARTMMRRAKELMDGATGKPKEIGYYRDQIIYWTQIFAQRRGEMTDMQKRYGAGLEKAHRQFVEDLVQFYHFKEKFTALGQVERAIANYQPDMLGMEVGSKEKALDGGARIMRSRAIVAETLDAEPALSFDEMKQYVPPAGQESAYDTVDKNILAELAYAFGDEDAAQVADLMQKHYTEEEEPAAAEAHELGVAGATLAELQERQGVLLGECEQMWEKKAIQKQWFDKNLHGLVLARLNEQRVLELPSTIHLMNEIAEVVRNHPNSTIGAALVGDPGVGKTTIVEHYLRKKGREFVYIDMTEEVTRYTLLGSPQTTFESQMDFYKRMSDEFGALSEEDVASMVKRNAAKLEHGFESLSEEERQALAVGMLQEQLDKAERLAGTIDPQMRAIFEHQVAASSATTPEERDAQALAVLKAQIDQGNPQFAAILVSKTAELRASGAYADEAQIEVAAQQALKESIENTHTSLRMDEGVKGKLGHVREALSKVARIKYQDEAANKFADLSKKNGWRDGLVIHALRTDKDILFDEFNGAKDWKLLHHLLTSKPGDDYIFGDKAGEKIKIPENWRMWFTANIQGKHGGNKLREALVSRIGGQVLPPVMPPPAHEEWLVVLASLSDANDRIVRNEKDIVQLGFLINTVLPRIRELLRKGGNIVPISFRMLGNITEHLMDHKTQFARPTSVDKAVLAEMIRPYVDYPDTQYPVTENTSQIPTMIARYLVEGGLLLSPEVEAEVMKWTGLTKEALEEKRKAFENKDYRQLMKDMRAGMQSAMTEMMPAQLAVS